MEYSLRPYQLDCEQKVRESFANGNKRPILVLPTGSGKTIIFCDMAKKSAATGRHVLILEHREELIKQASRKLSGNGLGHGIIAPGRSMTRDRIQVGSVQTVARRLDIIERPDFIIIDECHHSTAGAWRKIIDRFATVPMLGVTATPRRLDDSPLGIKAGGVFDDMIIGPTTRQLIDDGYLSDFAVYCPPTQIDLTDLKIQGGDYERGELGHRMNQATITGSAVEHYRKLGHGMPGLVFCASIEHAKTVAESFTVAGYRARSIDGKMPDPERRKAIDDLTGGYLDILTSCDIVSEGTDIPVVGVIIMLRPTCSESLYLQEVGRGLRLYPGKTETIILDHVGNCLVHGLPDDDREWSLYGPKRKKRSKKYDPDDPDIKLKQCPICYRAHEPAPACPFCGYEYPHRDRVPDEEAGELEKITAEEKKQLQKRRKFLMGQAQTLEDLQTLAAELGYKKSWAHFVWDARQKRRTGVQA